MLSMFTDSTLHLTGSFWQDKYLDWKQEKNTVYRWHAEIPTESTKMISTQKYTVSIHNNHL